MAHFYFVIIHVQTWHPAKEILREVIRSAGPETPYRRHQVANRKRPAAMIRKNPLRQEDGDENELFGFVMETAKRSARSLGMDKDEIEQIVSNVAFKLYTSPAFREVATGDRGSSRPRLNGYVRKTARRERAGVIEEKERQRQTQLPLNAVEDSHAEASDLCARIANAITLERAMEKLDPKLGRIVRMHIYDDMSMSEIAAKLDLPKATVKSRYRSARGQLRVLLGDQGDAEVN